MARNTNKPVNHAITIDVDQIDVSSDFLDNVGEWTSFYRCYPFVFAEDFLGVKLHPFQKILLYQMFHNDFSMFLAARGLGKSFLLAIFIVCYAVLYPRVKIVVSAAIKRQSLEVINYVKALYDESECLRRSVTYLSDSINDPRVAFASGSTFKVVVSNDNARGARTNVLVVDEARMVNLDAVTTILRPMAATYRPCKFYELPEWRDYPKEENKEIYTSSTYYCHHWLYDKFNDFINQMASGKSYFVADLPYQISVKAGMKSMKQIENQMTEDTFDVTKFAMEMEGRWIGQDSSSFFKHETLQPCRKLKKPFYADSIASVIAHKNKKYLKMDKIKSKTIDDNEIRVLFADIAIASSTTKQANDNTVIGVMRLIPHMVNGDESRKYYAREVVYMKAISGMRIDHQAIEIRKAFDMFKCDYVVLDGQGIGHTMYEELSKPITDTVTGIEYNVPWSCINYDKWKEKCTYPNAKPVIYAFIGSAKLNSDMHYEMLNCLTKKTISFVISEMESKEIIGAIGDLSTINIEDRATISEQYIQADMLMNEMMNLKRVDRDGGIVKLVEPSNGYKDRYMAVAMGNYMVTAEIEPALLKFENGYDVGNDIDWYFEL